MSIPLDRLYNFIDSLCDHDVLIYRFFPHGSKKLEHLLPLKNIPMGSQHWFNNITTPAMICHDQEPLHYELYQPSDFQPIWNALPGSPAAKELWKQLHLRSLTAFPFNIYDSTLLCHSEKNSEQLSIYESNGFVGVYWWSHGVVAQDWFRFAQHDPTLSISNIKTDFLIYNRAWTGTREYRLKFAEQVVKHSLVQHCNMAFSKTDGTQIYVDHQYANQAFKIDYTDLEHYLLPNNADSNSSADYNSSDYQTSAIEVVLETLFDDSRWHLTEKSLRPIACGRPFILAATPGSLQYLKSYGIKTFDGLIDETYDTIQDPLLRIAAIIKEMKRISLLTFGQKKVLWQQLYKISKQNQQLFFSDQWYNRITHELTQNLNSALKIMNTNKTGRYWQQLIATHPDPIIPNYRSDADKDRLKKYLLTIELSVTDKML